VHASIKNAFELPLSGRSIATAAAPIDVQVSDAGGSAGCAIHPATAGAMHGRAALATLLSLLAVYCTRVRRRSRRAAS
jgi:hypothetical protein